jgi:hypothetical protein
MNHCEDLLYLKNHPLVVIFEAPLQNLIITDGKNIRQRIISVNGSKINLIDRLKKNLEVKNRIFCVLPFSQDSLYNIIYNLIDFSRCKIIRYAEVEVTTEEWEYYMGKALNVKNKNYKYLLINR